MTTSPIVSSGKKPWWRRWWAITLVVLLVIGGLAAVAGPNEDEEPAPAASADNDSTLEGGDAEADSADVSSQDEQQDDTAATASPTTDAPTSEEQQDGSETTAPATTDPQPEEPEAPPIGTRDQPYAVGSPAVLTLDSFGDADGSVWAITVDGAGSDITQAVLDENMFNEPPVDGKLFYGVPVTMTLQSAGKEPLSPWFNLSVDFFGPSTLEIFSAGFSDGCGVTPNEIDSLKEVFVGGSISGTVCYSMTPADVDAGVMVTVDEIEGDRIFLATVDGHGTAASPAVEPVITTSPPMATDDGAAGSRSAPYPVGSPAVVTLDSFGDADGSVWAITVDGPGSDITQAVVDENMFNDPPADGRLFYGVPVTMTLQSAGTEPLSPWLNISVDFFGPSTLEIFSSGFSDGCGVTPNEIDPLKEVFVGGSISGTVCYSMTPADVEAGVMVTVDEIEGDRIFLATR